MAGGGHTLKLCPPPATYVPPLPHMSMAARAQPLPHMIWKCMVLQGFIRFSMEKLSQVAGGDVNGSRGAHTQTVPPLPQVCPPCHK